MELIGRRFGHIRITDVVGQGGMGDVYAGYDEKLDRKVALKALHADQRLDEEARERLLREARALSKLDHPNICRIYDYIESDDVDVLVLEFIDGQTLQDKIDERQLSRAERLRIATSVAEVLVGAHRYGIIHRDLKPENVMLTKAGEVKVLDFGLARWLNVMSSDKLKRISASREAIRSAPAVAVPMPAESDHEWFSYTKDGATQILSRSDSSVPATKRVFRGTEVGVTMGTPLYMSPEQARGEELTTASDMFSFGLLLQALFTGSEPHPPGLTAREVILRAARGETVAVQGAPGDITALINRLKQFAPADRPTAIESVARLRFMADKPARFARRSAIAAAILIVVFGAWRYTVDLARERTIAVKARDDARHRRAQAENLIEFILGDLSKKLKKVGRLEILEDAGNRALEYVESLRPEQMSTDELVWNTKALNQLGGVEVGQGKTPDALDLFRRALRLANEAVRREPRNPDALMVLGETRFWIGNGLRVEGKIDQALQHMTEYQKVAERLVALDPSNQKYQLERAYGHGNVASLLEMKGDVREALKHHKVSLAIKEDIARRSTDIDAQTDVAIAYNKVGVALYKLGELRESLGYLQRESDIYRDLVKRDPQDVQLKRRLTNSMAYTASALEDIGESEAAYALLQEELALEQQLAAHDPSNVDWQRNVAMTTRWIAKAVAERGDSARAAALYREARTQIGEVTRKAPSHVSFAVDASNVDSEYGRLLAMSGDPRGAGILRTTIRRLEGLQDSRERQYQLGRTSFFLGEAIQRTDPQSANAAWERAERELAPLVAKSSAPGELSIWMRLMLRRGRADQARATLTRLQNMGYATTELEKLCRDSGC